MIIVGCLSAAGLFADVLVSNIDGVNGTQAGYLNPGSSWGDLVSISGTGTIDSISFDVATAYSTYTNGTFKISFFNADAGLDAILGTGDDLIGSLLGSYTTPTMSIKSSTRTTVSGFSINVPASFIYTVQNFGGSLSYTMNTTATAPTIGVQYDNVLFYKDGSALTSGAAVSAFASTFKNYQVELGGTAVPEPATGMIVALGGGLLFFYRRFFERA